MSGCNSCLWSDQCHTSGSCEYLDDMNDGYKDDIDSRDDFFTEWNEYLDGFYER